MSFTLTPLPAADHHAWRTSLEQRLIAQRTRTSPQTAAQVEASIRAMIGRWFSGDDPGPGTHLLEISRGGDAVGSCGVLLDPSGSEAFVLDVTTTIAVGDGEARDLRAAVIAYVRQAQIERLTVRRPTDEDAAAKIIAAGPHELAASRMIHSLREPASNDDRVVDVELRPMSPAQYQQFEEQLISTYAESRARAGVVSPERSLEQAREQTASLLPQGLDTPHHLIRQAYVAGEDVGILWLFEESGDGGHRGYVYNVEVVESERGRGFGRGIMAAGEALLRDLGVEFVELNVFGFNDLARSLYLSMGYLVSEEMFAVPMSEG